MGEEKRRRELRAVTGLAVMILVARPDPTKNALKTAASANQTQSRALIPRRSLQFQKPARRKELGKGLRRPSGLHIRGTGYKIGHRHSLQAQSTFTCSARHCPQGTKSFPRFEFSSRSFFSGSRPIRQSITVCTSRDSHSIMTSAFFCAGSSRICYHVTPRLVGQGTGVSCRDLQSPSLCALGDITHRILPPVSVPESTQYLYLALQNAVEAPGGINITQIGMRAEYNPSRLSAEVCK